MNSTKSAHALSLLIVGVGIAVNGYSQSFVTNGLVAYYPFNGNPNDASGNGNNGTVSDAQLTADRFNNPNHAYNFTNDVNSMISVADSASLDAGTNLTISLWFKYFEPFIDHDESLLWRASGTFPAYTGWWLDIDGHEQTYSLHYDRSASPFIVTVTNTVQYTQLQQWNHVAVVDGGTFVELFLNGVLVNQINTSASVATTAPIVIGGAIHPVSGAYDRDIDDVRIYNRALSTNEVAQLYSLESGPTLNVRKAVYLDSSNLWVGTNYQIQVSTDLNTWTNYGTPFTATNSTWRSTNYWDVDDWSELFFRLQTTP